ncbi:hypothetical protein FRB99_006481 [Tulasnella sp. 403]|nr:hypothetical protein FRB99_006481 [Tulasnella sp. 403]
MIDLAQASLALRNCTQRSLIILDELGKGTNASDGAGLLCGVLKYLLNQGPECPKVLAATHFHDIFGNDLLGSHWPLKQTHMQVISTEVLETHRHGEDPKKTNQVLTFLYNDKLLAHDVVSLLDEAMSGKEIAELKSAESVTRSFCGLDLTKSVNLKQNIAGIIDRTDHMLTIPWTTSDGWGAPRIHPYGPLSLEPCSTVLHYCQTVFEGMKAYRDENGKVTLFRPDMNMRRMVRSAQRVALPSFDGNELIKLIKKLVALDAHWIPQVPGYSLYIRPTLIGNQSALGVGPPNQALLFVICSPVGPYYKGGFKPVKLLATTEYVRAVPGGTGSYKLGANYAPCLIPQAEAMKKGYDQNLWLLGEEHLLTEVGTMNLFVVLKKDDGTIELVTPPLEDVILPGVTRDSVLALARDHAAGLLRLPGLPSKLQVSERAITMGEVKNAAANGQLLEVFGSGTAAIVCPVKTIGYMGSDIPVPVGEEGMGPITKALLDEIVKRQLGVVESEWSVTVTE